MYLGIGAVVMSLVVLLWWTFLFFDSALGTWLFYKWIIGEPDPDGWFFDYWWFGVFIPVVSWLIGSIVWPLVILAPFAITLWFVVRHFSDKIKSSFPKV